MFKHSAVVLAVAVMICCGGIAVWSQNAAPAGQEATSTTSVAPASVEITPNPLDVHVGEKVKFSAAAKDAAGNAIDAKPSVWFAAPFDLAGADESGEVTFHAPGVVTVGAVIAGKTGYATVNVGNPKIASVEIVKPEYPIVVGGAEKLTVVARSAEGNPRGDAVLKWASEKPSIASVDAAGLVTGIAPGTVTLKATTEGAGNSVTLQVVRDAVHKLTIKPASAEGRTGDVVHFSAEALDGSGGHLKNSSVRWSLSSSGAGAIVYPDGAFVAEKAGTYVVIASSGQHSAAGSVVVRPRNVEREVNVVAHVPMPDLQMSEEWIIGHHAYLSTIADKLFVYDIADPANPKLLDSLKVDARLINDISTTPDEKIGVFTREGASNRKNGIVFLDTSDPSHLKVLSEYTATVTGGVHSAYIDGHYVYITDDATGSLRVIDFQDPKHPKEVARWQTENPTVVSINTEHGSITSGRYLHDLQVKDGLAYLAYWRDGLIILDVGNGMAGGSPENPKLVVQYRFNHYELYGDGWLAGTHSVFRYKDYLFVGDEVFPAIFELEDRDRIPVRAICHVMDVSDIKHPREVAQYEVPEGGSHNFWAANDMLYEGYYSGGARVLDISGELRGDLYRQGREIARFWTGDAKGFRPNLPFTWGGQPCSVACDSPLLNSLMYFNDIHSGLWITKLGEPKFEGSTSSPAVRKGERTIH
ncbi:MAG TPA: Ig-like domain-containing protein [Candidatus Sulfotelmatobacter sp.]|nr:Ig-like domain-containing protein [Candidatus Sulfotelmatobacter sp.]